MAWRSRPGPFGPGAPTRLFFILAFALAGCHAAPRPSSVPASPAASPVAQLQRDLNRTLAAPALARGYWGIVVKSLKNDETLYTLNAGKLLMPGSALKVVTLAAAAERLGWEYTYETRLAAGGTIEAGVLNGDLLVIGSGDPSIVDRDGVAARIFVDWANALRSKGVRAIAGRIIGDDNTFDDEDLGAGWAWDDLVEGFAAGVGALQFNENTARVTIVPGAAVGAPALITIAPAVSTLVIQNGLRTAPANTIASIEVRRLPGSARLILGGSVPLGSGPVGHTVSVDNPTLFFVTALREALIAAGIDVHGAAVDIDDLADAPSRATSATLVTYRSPPLSTLATTMMKVSQNLYAETLLKTIGAAVGAPTMETGRTAAKAALQTWGVSPADLIQVDGSGLSRYNYLTPETLVTILTHVDRDERLRGPFEAALPIAGRDGTLAARLKGTPAEGNARAKTGTLANVRALAGYVSSADNEPLVFAIVANNYGTTPDVVLAAIDAIVVKLAEFRR